MNTTISPEQLVHQLKWRYATKQFDAARKILARDWAALEEALLLSPSSCGLQPWKFIVVKDPAMRAKLRTASWDQSQITDASHMVVLAAVADIGQAEIDGWVERISTVRGIPAESLAGYKQMMVGLLLQGMDAAGRRNWATNQTFIALGNLLDAAAFLGIDACPMEGFDHAKYDEILGLPAKGLVSAVVATLGYRAATDKYGTLAKVRYPREKVFLEV